MAEFSNRVRVPDLPALTGIRFIAASLVFLTHVTKIEGLGWLAKFFIFDLATFGVAFFFVLSGFILTYNYVGIFGTSVQAGSYGRFIWDRLSKVYPLYFLTMILCIPIQLIGHHRDWSWEALGLHLTLTQCLFPVQNLKLTDQFNVPGWSISCEMLFYLLTPFLIWGLSSFKRLNQILLAAVSVWLVSMLVIGSQAGGLIWPARFAPLRVPEFFLGAAAAICFLRFQGVFKKIRWFFPLGLLLVAVACACDAYLPRYLQAGPMVAPGAALLIYGLARGRSLATLCLSNRWVVLLGSASFAFYLIHDPVIRICKNLFQRCQLIPSGPWSSIIVAILLFVLVQLLSILLFKKIEIPLQCKLRALIRKPAAKTAVSKGSEPAVPIKTEIST